MNAATCRRNVLVAVDGTTAPFIIAPPGEADSLRRLLEARGLTGPGIFRAPDGSALIHLVAGVDSDRVRDAINESP
jgi:hypothetical protein